MGLANKETIHANMDKDLVARMKLIALYRSLDGEPACTWQDVMRETLAKSFPSNMKLGSKATKTKTKKRNGGAR